MKWKKKNWIWRNSHNIFTTPSCQPKFIINGYTVCQMSNWVPWDNQSSQRAQRFTRFHFTVHVAHSQTERWNTSKTTVWHTRWNHWIFDMDSTILIAMHMSSGRKEFFFNVPKDSNAYINHFLEFQWQLGFRSIKENLGGMI